MPPAPTRIVLVPSATKPMATEVAALAIAGHVVVLGEPEAVVAEPPRRAGRARGCGAARSAPLPPSGICARSRIEIDETFIYFDDSFIYLVAPQPCRTDRALVRHASSRDDRGSGSAGRAAGAGARVDRVHRVGDRPGDRDRHGHRSARRSGPGRSRTGGRADNRTVYTLGPSRVETLDVASNTPGAAIPAPLGARKLAITPDGATLLVGSEGANVVVPIATATNQPGAAISLNGPKDLAIAPDGRTAYVLTAGSTLTPIDLRTKTTRPAIALAHPGRAIEITPDGALAVISESEGEAGFVQTVDLPAGAPGVRSWSPTNRWATWRSRPTGARPTSWPRGVRLRGLPTKEPAVYPFTIASRTVGVKLPMTFLFGIGKLAVSADSSRLFGWSCRQPDVLLRPRVRPAPVRAGSRRHAVQRQRRLAQQPGLDRARAESGGVVYRHTRPHERRDELRRRRLQQRRRRGGATPGISATG